MSEKKKNWPDLQPGDLVFVKQKIPEDITNVQLGDLGVCFYEAEHYEPNTGPMVRFVSGAACNVYEDWVEKVER